MVGLVEALVLAYKLQRDKWRKKHVRMLRILHIFTQRRRNIMRNLLALHSITASLDQIRHATRERKTRSARRIRNGGWWRMVLQEFDEERFIKTFRLSWNTFWWILGKIKSKLEKEDKGVGHISSDERLAICLYRLSRGDYLFTIGELFGYAECTVGEIVIEVCHAIVDSLWSESVTKNFPKNDVEFKHMMNVMNAEWQFKFAFAACDGSHLRIKCPGGGAESRKSYFNFKGFYSIVLMALVDAKYRFMWASVGMPGNTHDSTNFQSTRLWHDVINGDILPHKAQISSGLEVPPLILTDGAFPFRTWFMKPYGNAVLTADQRYFNYRLSRARMVVEGSFGLLKSRFRILHRKCETCKDTTVIMALACIILRIICIERGDTLPRHFDLSLDLAANRRRSSDEIRDLLNMTDACRKTLNSVFRLEAERIRDAIKEKFWEEKIMSDSV